MNGRIATLMVHTSPLDQPGIGDAGGMNIYVLESAQRMAAMGVSVDIFTRRTGADAPEIVEISPGVRVRHFDCGHGELTKEQLPAHIAGLSRAFLQIMKKRKLRCYSFTLLALWKSCDGCSKRVSDTFSTHHAYNSSCKEFKFGRR
jgi:hypothetical protein